MAQGTREGDRRNTPFGDALRYWRKQRGLSQRALAPKIETDHSRLSRIETGQIEASRDEVTRADRILRTGGALVAAYQRQRGGRPRPRELPAAPGWLGGRDTQLDALDKALAGRNCDAPLLVVIDGPAGAGKTALALRWAHRNAHEFPDGQIYADLKAFAPEGQQIDLATVLFGFCRALGASAEEIPDTLNDRASLWRSLMAGTRRLVMLDNVATADDVRLLMPGAAECTVVVTSRRVLSALAVTHEAHRVPVGPLEPDHSASLMTHFIGERALGEFAAVAELTRLCGHLPLALRVAAELAVVHPARSLADLADEIGAERLEALEADESTAPRAVFSWTYRDLPDDAARVFRLLGLQRGRRISIPAIAALAGISVRQARSAVRQLRAVHMLDTTSNDAAEVVGVHDLLHAYAMELVEAAETPAARDAARHRLVLWTLHTVRAAGQALAPDGTTNLDLPDLPTGLEPLTFADPEIALSWCDRERENLLAVSNLAATHGPPGATWRLAIAMWDWLSIRRPWDLWRDTHLLGIRAASAEHDSHGEAWVTGHWAEALRRQGHLDEARELSDRVLEFQRRGGDNHKKVWAVVVAANIALDQGDLERAHDLVDQVLRHDRDEQVVADRDANASIHVVAARTLSARGEHDAALTYLDRADDLLPHGKAARRHHLLPARAAVHLARGDYTAALEALDRAADGHAAVQDLCSEAEARTRCGNLRAELPEGDPDRKPVPDWARARDLMTQLGEHCALLDDKILRHLASAQQDEPRAC
ncbi:MAG: helix-turn-helix domain-containing protein [Actinophytocola sp.]|uniref:helix-turn-helix domain-containing protein n=1 Tax=Actinophytocola sp. TaxID=1872138 RepID=UPI003C779305